MTSAYCLLSYIPFTYQWVIKCTLVKWLPVFVKLHPMLYWLAVAPAIVSIIPQVRRPSVRRIAIGFIILQTLTGLVLLLHPLLSKLPNDDRSFYWSVISLFPIVWLAAIDHETSRGGVWENGDDDHIAASTMLTAAGFLSLLYLGNFYLRSVSSGETQLRRTEFVVVLCWSLATHLLVFTLAFGVLRLLSGLARKFTRSSKAEFAICNVLIGLIMAL